MRISDWSSDVFSSDLLPLPARRCCATILAGAAKRMVGLAGTEAQWSRHILTHSLDGRDGRRTRRLPSMPSPAMDSPVSAAAMQTRRIAGRSEEHTSELQSLMRISYAVFCLQKKKT